MASGTPSNTSSDQRTQPLFPSPPPKLTPTFPFDEIYISWYKLPDNTTYSAGTSGQAYKFTIFEEYHDKISRGAFPSVFEQVQELLTGTSPFFDYLPGVRIVAAGLRSSVRITKKTAFDEVRMCV